MIRFCRRTTGMNLNFLHSQVGNQFCWRKKFVEKMEERRKEEANMWQKAKSEEELEQLRKIQEKLTEDEKQMINAYKVDKEPNHNFQKEIIVHKKMFDQSTQQLRSAILFQDLLKTQVDITVYDTKGKPFVHKVLRFLYLMFTVGAALWSINMLRKIDARNDVLLDRTTMGKIIKYSVVSMAVLLFIASVVRYKKFCTKYVEKVVYNTQKQEFSITKRTFLGKKYNYPISRFKLLYTQNKFLNSQGTNYFDIDTKQEFSIAYKQFWIKQDLFSHLIAQRIKL